MKIAVFGFGAVGRKLAHLFSSAGHEVILGQRRAVATSEFPSFEFSDALSRVDVVALAIPFSACEAILEPLADLFDGKLIIDATNPLNEDWSPRILGPTSSAGEETASWVPKASVVKAFSTIFADVMEEPKRSENRISAFDAGDYEVSRAAVARLASDAGFEPVDTGPLSSDPYLEAMAHLNIRIAVGMDGVMNAAFIYDRG